MPWYYSPPQPSRLLQALGFKSAPRVEVEVLEVDFVKGYARVRMPVSKDSFIGRYGARYIVRRIPRSALERE